MGGCVTKEKDYAPNIFVINNINEDEKVVQPKGLLEVNQNELNIYPSNYSEAADRWTWPLKYLRKYGSSDEVFAFEAGRGCPNGEGLYAFTSKRSSEIVEMVERNLHHNRHQPTLEHNGEGSCTNLTKNKSANIFKVENINENENLVQKGLLEVSDTEVIYTDNASADRWTWPLKYLRKYGCDGEVFSFEAGRKCPGGEGLYAFSSKRASRIFEMVTRNINHNYHEQIAEREVTAQPSQANRRTMSFAIRLPTPPVQLHGSLASNIACTSNPKISNTSTLGTSEHDRLEHRDSNFLDAGPSNTQKDLDGYRDLKCFERDHQKQINEKSRKEEARYCDLQDFDRDHSSTTLNKSESSTTDLECGYRDMRSYEKDHHIMTPSQESRIFSTPKPGCSKSTKRDHPILMEQETSFSKSDEHTCINCYSELEF